MKYAKILLALALAFSAEAFSPRTWNIWQYISLWLNNSWLDTDQDSVRELWIAPNDAAAWRPEFPIALLCSLYPFLVCFFFLLNIHAEANKASNKPVISDLKKAAVNTMAALAIGSSVLSTPVVADAMDMSVFSSTQVVAEKVVRQGLYQDYTVEVEQEYDNAKSTFKSASETKSKKGKSFRES